MEKRITKREKFEMLLEIGEVKNNKMLVDFIKHEIELNSKKRSASKAVTEVNSKLAEIITNILMNASNPMTVTQILENESLKDFTYEEGKEIKKLTNQKVNAILQGLVNDKIVVNTKEKKKSFYSIVK